MRQNNRTQALIAELIRDAEQSKFAALVVRFEAGDQYVSVRDKPSPEQRLEEMMAAEGDPIAVVRALDSKGEGVMVRFLTDFFGDPPSPVEKAKVAREFRRYLKEHPAEA